VLAVAVGVDAAVVADLEIAEALSGAAWPSLQVTPQSPQLARSTAVITQVPLQSF
jgi:hypothetical protein